MEKTAFFRLKVAVVMGVGLVAISFGSIFVRYSQEASSLVIAFYRMAWATALTAPFYWWRPRRRPVASWKIELAAGAALALHFAFWIASLDYTTVAVSVLLVNASPVLVAIASAIFFQERLSRRGIWGIALCFTGSAILLGHDLLALGDGRGPVLALLGAAMLGVYLLIGRQVRQSRSLMDYVFPTYLAAALLLLAMAAVAGQPLRGFSPPTWLFLLLLGLVPQGLGHTSYNWALGYLPATVVSTLILAEPVLASLLAWWLLGEAWTAVIGLGGGLVAAGIFLVARWGIETDRIDVEVSLVLLWEGESVWVQRRREPGPLDGLWEFPGGKVEPGESPEEAALRELREECGLSLEPAALNRLTTVRHRYPEGTVRLNCFLAQPPEETEPAGSEGMWVAMPELARLPMPAANRAILQALQRKKKSRREVTRIRANKMQR